MGNYFVYILYSVSFNRTYVGQTNNLSDRLTKHNSGRVRSTKAYRPWILIHSEPFLSRAEAMKKEKWYKLNIGRKKIRELLSLYLAEGNGLSVPILSGRDPDSVKTESD
ncbi:MAG TPA: GIY-YIG nuclease family protein [Ignavibacteriaceae bacterium]|nr:GIY-YIG nuclease family protein [Ignavibacteriaceae bacterium]